MKEGTWSDMRKYLEEEMLADCLKGRIGWNCTQYVNTGGAGTFEIRVDGCTAKRFSMEDVVQEACGPRKPDGCRDMHYFWEVYWRQKKLPPMQRCEFDDEDLSLALMEYRCLPVQEALVSDDPVVRLFAVLDRRIGKSTLESLARELDSQPEWLRPFFLLRMRAEGTCC